MWAQIVKVAIGIWLMMAPAVLGYGNPAMTNDRIVGPLCAAFGIISCWEVTRGARWVHVPVGLWLLAAPWLLGYSNVGPRINDMAWGAVLLGLSTIKGSVSSQYGGGWKAVWG